MSEMLGNQYFMARNYPQAALQLAGVLKKHPRSKIIRRRLIVCYLQIGEIDRAFDLFFRLACDDIEFIINTDPIDDDCPCPELTARGELAFGEVEPTLDLALKMGMLWLYCDTQKSLSYFRRALELQPDTRRIATVCNLIEQHIAGHAVRH